MRKRSSLGRRSLLDIEEDLVKKLGVKPGSKGISVIDRAVRDANVSGIRMAAAVASNYDKYNSHPYLVSECILGKLNVMTGRPGRNPAAAELEHVLSRLEQKITSLEGTMRFLAMSSKREPPAKPVKELQHFGKRMKQVRHQDLTRAARDGSGLASNCPTCKQGVLLMRRNPRTLVLEEWDLCVLCGQQFIYQDIASLREKDRRTPARRKGERRVPGDSFVLGSLLADERRRHTRRDGATRRT